MPLDQIRGAIYFIACHGCIMLDTFEKLAKRNFFSSVGEHKSAVEKTQAHKSALDNAILA